MLSSAHADAMDVVDKFEGTKLERVVCAAFVYIGVLVLSLTIALINKAIACGRRLARMVEEAP